MNSKHKAGATRPTSKKRLSSLLKQVNLYAAGIDVGATEHFVAVPEGLDDHPIRSFSCSTEDSPRIKWLFCAPI